MRCRCVIIARGCGMALNFNSAMILIPMLRYSLTWLRTTRASRFLPLDNMLSIHKLVGIVTALFGVVHVAAHLGNLGKLVYLDYKMYE